METMGLMGFIFGMSGLSFAVIVYEQMTKLKKDVERLSALVDSNQKGNENE